MVGNFPLIYSCFEKGSLTNREKLTRQCRTLLWVIVVFTVAWVNLKVFQRGGRKQNKHVFLLSRSLLMNHLEPESSKAKLLLPIIPIEIAFTFFHSCGTAFVETAVFNTVPLLPQHNASYKGIHPWLKPLISRARPLCTWRRAREPTRRLAILWRIDSLYQVTL